MFCEDPATTQSDEFFGIFDSFVSGFHEAKMDNDAVKRKREEEEKIAKQQQEVSCLNNKIVGVTPHQKRTQDRFWIPATFPVP